MHRLRTIAALALCALYACAPITINTAPTEPQPSGEDERVGSFTDLNARRTEFTRASTVLSDGSHVEWGHGHYVYNSTYWVGGNSNADVNSSAIDARAAHSVWFKIELTTASTPVGNFSIQISDDGSSDWQELYIDANRVYADNIGAFSGGTTIPVSSPAGAVLIYVGVENPMSYLRVLYDRTSGGTTGTISATSFVRGM